MLESQIAIRKIVYVRSFNKESKAALTTAFLDSNGDLGCLFQCQRRLCLSLLMHYVLVPCCNKKPSHVYPSRDVRHSISWINVWNSTVLICHLEHSQNAVLIFLQVNYLPTNFTVFYVCIGRVIAYQSSAYSFKSSVLSYTDSL